MTQKIFLPVVRNPSGSPTLFEKFMSILVKKSSYRLAQDLRRYTYSFFQSNGLIPGGGKASNFIITVSFELFIYLEGQIHLRPFYSLRRFQKTYGPQRLCWSIRSSSEPTRRLFASNWRSECTFIICRAEFSFIFI